MTTQGSTYDQTNITNKFLSLSRYEKIIHMSHLNIINFESLFNIKTIIDQ